MGEIQERTEGMKQRCVTNTWTDLLKNKKKTKIHGQSRYYVQKSPETKNKF